MRQEGAMPKMVIAPRIKSFICLNAHPSGCAANVDREIAIATKAAPGSGLKHALVIGASTGYGLSSLVSAVFGYGARGMAICLERLF
jgi:enoyl-[acyl-carrier protein] reductase/trans-2-enoyl-CoA reductase (NAD+)